MSKGKTYLTREDLAESIELGLGIEVKDVVIVEPDEFNMILVECTNEECKGTGTIERGDFSDGSEFYTTAICGVCNGEKKVESEYKGW